jgi:hypothetical protein
MYEASIPEFSFRKTGVCNVITKKIFAKYVLNSDLRPQMYHSRNVLANSLIGAVGDGRHGAETYAAGVDRMSNLNNLTVGRYKVHLD